MNVEKEFEDMRQRSSTASDVLSFCESTRPYPKITKDMVDKDSYKNCLFNFLKQGDN